MTNLLNCENENDAANKYIDVAKNCKVIKNWLFKQKQVYIILLYYFCYFCDEK